MRAGAESHAPGGQPAVADVMGQSFGAQRITSWSLMAHQHISGMLCPILLFGNDYSLNNDKNDKNEV